MKLQIPTILSHTMQDSSASVGTIPCSPLRSVNVPQTLSNKKMGGAGPKKGRNSGPGGQHTSSISFSHCLQPSPSLLQFHHHLLLELVACLTKVLFVLLLLCLYFCITQPSFILEFYCLTSQITNILCLLLFQAILTKATIGFSTKSEEQIWSWQKIRDFII